MYWGRRGTDLVRMQARSKLFEESEAGFLLDGQGLSHFLLGQDEAACLAVERG